MRTGGGGARRARTSASVVGARDVGEIEAIRGTGGGGAGRAKVGACRCDFNRTTSLRNFEISSSRCAKASIVLVAIISGATVSAMVDRSVDDADSARFD